MPKGIVNLYLDTEGSVIEQANTEYCEGHDSCDSSTCDGDHCQSEE